RAPAAHRGEDRPDRAHEAHHVQLPHLVPLLVGQLLEARLVGDPNVVDEAVDLTQRRRYFVDDLTRRLGLPQVGGDAENRAGRLARVFHALRVAADDGYSGALGGEELGRCQPDSVAGAGDDADTVTEADVQSRGSLVRP